MKIYDMDQIGFIVLTEPSRNTTQILPPSN